MLSDLCGKFASKLRFQLSAADASPLLIDCTAGHLRLSSCIASLSWLLARTGLSADVRFSSPVATGAVPSPLIPLSLTSCGNLKFQSNQTCRVPVPAAVPIRDESRRAHRGQSLMARTACTSGGSIPLAAAVIRVVKKRPGLQESMTSS